MILISKLLHAAYRVLLYTYPRAFRADCSVEMIETLRSREEEVRTRKGLFGMVRFWSKELSAAFRAGIRLRLEGPDDPSRSMGQFAAQAWYDTRFALRSLSRSPVFTATAVLTVALGIGATTVIFSFVNGILLSPLPYERPTDLVAVRTFDGSGTSISEPEFLAFRSEARSLASITAARDVSRTLQLDEPRRITAMEATHELFPILGVPPLLGRTFTNQEDLTGASRVTVLSHSLWQEMYGGDPGAVGRNVTLDGESYEIIGVMPAGFYFPTPEIVLWSPYQIDPANPDNWNNHYLEGYARLKDGFDLETARSEIIAMGDRFVVEHAEFLEKLGFSADLVPLFENMVGESRTPLLVLLGAVGFLLLIGCTNVANLLLARGENRKQEIAVRSALGASRGRVVQQLLMESVVLSVVGGSVGLVLAPWGIRTLRTAAMDSIPRVESIGIDPRVFVFAALATLSTGLLFGILPAIAGSRSNLQTHLKEGGRTFTGSQTGNRTRRVLVACEVAFSVVLVIGAGIMLRSLANLQRTDTGFRTDDVLTMRVSLPDGGRAADQEIVIFYENLVEEVEALPGVRSAGVVGRLPLFQGIGLWSIQIEGREVATVGEAPIAELQQATPGYFETMNLTLLEGRFLDRTDNAGTRMVALVNEAFARLHWPGESVTGRRIKLYSNRLPWIDIVGVVKNERHNGLVGGVRPKMYIPHAQATESAYRANTTMNLVVLGEDIEPFAHPIRALVNELNSAAPVYHVQTMKEVKSASMVDRSYPTLLLTIFGLVALFLASIGIYGLVAFQVNQGRHDIGVHVALGATTASVRRMVLGTGLVPVSVGIAFGLAGAFGLTRLLGSLLYEVSPLDPAVYLGVPSILLLVAATASLVPAIRATRINPVEILRSE